MSLINILNYNHNRRLIKIVNSSIRSNKNLPIKILADDTLIEKVDYAFPYTGSQIDKEYSPYTDIIFNNKNSKSLNISLESTERKFTLKTGIKGINVVVPGLGDRFISRLRSENTVQGIQGIAAKLSISNKNRVLTGIAALGGPIDYYLEDKDNMEYVYEKGQLTFKNGKLYTPKEFSNAVDVYLRLINTDDKYTTEDIKKLTYENTKENIEVTTELPETITNIIELI